MGRRRMTEGDKERRGTVGDSWGQQNVIRPGPSLLLIEQIQKRTRRDDTMLSILVLGKDRWTAPLQTLKAAIGIRRR